MLVSGSVHSDPAEHGAPRLPNVGMDSSACLSCGMVVNTSVRHRAGCRWQLECWLVGV